MTVRIAPRGLIELPRASSHGTSAGMMALMRPATEVSRGR